MEKTKDQGFNNGRGSTTETVSLPQPIDGGAQSTDTGAQSVLTPDKTTPMEYPWALGEEPSPQASDSSQSDSDSADGTSGRDVSKVSLNLPILPLEDVKLYGELNKMIAKKLGLQVSEPRP